tara:strand:- start:7 stop:504 length:498 start_codon:yes stop_codon:yes gene_type:complete
MTYYLSAIYKYFFPVIECDDTTKINYEQCLKDLLKNYKPPMPPRRKKAPPVPPRKSKPVIVLPEIIQEKVETEIIEEKVETALKIIEDKRALLIYPIKNLTFSKPKEEIVHPDVPSPKPKPKPIVNVLEVMHILKTLEIESELDYDSIDSSESDSEEYLTCDDVD